MFQFRRFPRYTYVFSITYQSITSGGFPHSDIHGSMPACGSPWLFAACHVLHRLPVPRHSPCALCSLTVFVRFGSQSILRLIFGNCSFFTRFFIFNNKKSSIALSRFTFFFIQFSRYRPAVLQQMLESRCQKPEAVARVFLLFSLVPADF